MVLLSTLALAALGFTSVAGYDQTRKDNLVVYYGQNSYGATHGTDTTNWQKRLSAYCGDDVINAIPIGFVHIFHDLGGLPSLNLANVSNTGDNALFPGTNLPNCQFLAADIQACQAKGKLITLSLGGATGATTFSSDADAVTFANTIWNLFLGGASSTRPFGAAVLDGVDLDIEGGSGAGLPAFVARIKTLAGGATKKYWITAAPQCVFPDASLGSVLNAAEFDAVYVQFYNNWCGVHNFDNIWAWNFDVWDNWAKTVSKNRNVKIFIGAPAAPTAAGSGYVSAARLGEIAQKTKAQYSSFGGIMLWDVSQAYANGRYDIAIKSALTGGSTPPPSPTSVPPSPTSTPPPTGGCNGVAVWSAGSVYVGGQKAVYQNKIWTAKWWTQGDAPGGPAGVWSDGGGCFARTTEGERKASRHFML